MSRGRVFARLLAVSYLAALLVTWLVLRHVGERHFITTIALYLPRIGFALPLPFVVGACLVTGEKRNGLLVGVLALLFVLFPLMGLQLFGKSEQATPSIRVMSWNTFFGRITNELIFQKVLDESPDIFLGQATAHRTKELFRADPHGYEIHSDDEFFLLSRYPVVDKYVSPQLDEGDYHRGNFVRYTIKTPLGLLDVINTHPKSPRNGLEGLRGRGLKTRVLEGDLPDEAALPLNENTRLRTRQVKAAMAEIARCKNPILIAGDTNLPTLSWLYHQSYGNYTDGFQAAGRGFGYTFPAKRPWMRIDRILAGPELRFLRFFTGSVISSDHLYVVAELGLAQR